MAYLAAGAAAALAASGLLAFAASGRIRSWPRALLLIAGVAIVTFVVFALLAHGYEPTFTSD